MLRDDGRITMSLSPYQGLYDKVVPKDNLLRRIKEHIDFSFVNPMLRTQYFEKFGRPAKGPDNGRYIGGDASGKNTADNRKGID